MRIKGLLERVVFISDEGIRTGLIAGYEPLNNTFDISTEGGRIHKVLKRNMSNIVYDEHTWLTEDPKLSVWQGQPSLDVNHSTGLREPVKEFELDQKVNVWYWDKSSQKSYFKEGVIVQKQKNKCDYIVKLYEDYRLYLCPDYKIFEVDTDEF